MTPRNSATAGQGERTPRRFLIFRVGLILDPHMDKFYQRNAEASRKIQVPSALSAKEFHNALRHAFPRLGSTDFQLVRVDGCRRILALKVSPMTLLALKNSNELHRSALYILPKESLGGTREKRVRPFMVFRVGLLLDPHMDKFLRLKAEASRKIRVPSSLSAKDFHNVLRGMFPRLGSTDFRLVKVDGLRRITDLQVSPVTPAALKSSGELNRSGLYILPKEHLRKEDGQRVFVNQDLSYTANDASHDDEAGMSSQQVTRRARKTVAICKTPMKRSQEKFLPLKVGLLLDPRMDSLKTTKVETRKIRVPRSLSAKEFREVLRHAFPRLGSTDFQVVKVDSLKRIMTLRLFPITPATLISSGALKRSGIYLRPKECLAGQTGEPQDGNHTRVNCVGSHIETSSNASDCLDDPVHNESDFGNSETERSPQRSCKDQDVITPKAQQKAPSETSCANGSAAYVSPPNLFLLCTSENDEADLSVSTSDGAVTSPVDIPVSVSNGAVTSPVDLPVSISNGRPTVTSPQQEPMRVVTVKLEDCLKMLGPNGVYKIPTEDDDHDDEGSCGYDQHDDGDDDDDDDDNIGDDGDRDEGSDYNPADEDVDSSSDDGGECSTTLPNLTTKSNPLGPKKSHECTDCGERFPSASRLLVHKKTIHLKSKMGGSKQDVAKPYECGDCGKGFSLLGYLAIHQRKHTGKKVSHECRECGKTFAYRCHLVNHRKIHVQRKSFACTQCDKAFAVARYLDAHIKRLHKPNMVYQCSHCSEIFAKASLLTIHRQGPCKEFLERDRKSHQCDECGKILTTRQNLKEHKLIHRGERPHACTHCDKAFVRRTDLYVHLSRKHSLGPYKERVKRNHQCDECGKCFSSRASLVYHKRIHTGEKPYICEVCNKAFAARGNLKEHLSYHNQEKTHKCSLCPKAFHTARDLKKHMRSHTGEKPHVCTVCSKAFSSRGSLRNHSTLHTDMRPYLCLQCGKSFRTSNRLKAHEKTHTEEKTHPCPHCGRLFRTKQTMKRHIPTHTGERPYKCSFCDKRFIGHIGRTKHERTHTGEKPFSCSICGKAFAVKDALKTHQIVHTGDKPLRCRICGEKFSYFQTLQSHQKREHGIEPSHKCSQCGNIFKTAKELKSHECVQGGNKKTVEEVEEAVNGLKATQN